VGEPSVTLLLSELPVHTHAAQVAAASTTAAPGPTTVFGGGGRGKEPAYAPASAANGAALNPQAVAPVGGSQPHNNMPPYLTLNFIIALQGIFPPRS
jgi:microcystin-dependent protein